MSVQLIVKEGEPIYAIVPYDLYTQLVDDAEALQDIRDFDEAVLRIETGEELVPAALAAAMVAGLNPVRAWRQHRGLTQAQLAVAAGISKPYLSQIENGKRKGTVEVMGALAQAMNLDLADVVDLQGIE